MFFVNTFFVRFMLSIKNNGATPLWSPIVPENTGDHSAASPLEMLRHYNLQMEIHVRLYSPRKFADDGHTPHAKSMFRKTNQHMVLRKYIYIIYICLNYKNREQTENGDTPLWSPADETFYWSWRHLPLQRFAIDLDFLKSKICSKKYGYGAWLFMSNN